MQIIVRAKEERWFQTRDNPNRHEATSGPKSASAIAPGSPCAENDRDAIWKIFRAVVARGDTYVFDPHISRTKALGYWFGQKRRCYVAVSDERILGTYILNANQPGLGSHVANAGFMVAPSAQGRGIGRSMAVHCLREAERLGFRAMQFNLRRLYQQNCTTPLERPGFRIAGRLPGAFRHTPGRICRCLCDVSAA